MNREDFKNPVPPKEEKEISHIGLVIIILGIAAILGFVIPWLIIILTYK